MQVDVVCLDLFLDSQSVEQLMNETLLIWYDAISGRFYFQAHFKGSTYQTFLHEIIPSFSFPPRVELLFWSHALFQPGCSN